MKWESISLLDRRRARLVLVQTLPRACAEFARLLEPLARKAERHHHQARIVGTDGSELRRGHLPMNHLGTLAGRGRVLVDGKDVGNIDYDIHIYQQDPPHGTKKSYGTATGAAPTLTAAYNARELAILELQSGGTVSFMIKHVHDGEGAEITISGPIPGF
jgi:hypothetical protein